MPQGACCVDRGVRHRAARRDEAHAEEFLQGMTQQRHFAPPRISSSLLLTCGELSRGLFARRGCARTRAHPCDFLIFLLFGAALLPTSFLSRVQETGETSKTSIGLARFDGLALLQNSAVLLAVRVEGKSPCGGGRPAELLAVMPLRTVTVDCCGAACRFSTRPSMRHVQRTAAENEQRDSSPPAGSSHLLTATPPLDGLSVSSVAQPGQKDPSQH